MYDYKEQAEYLTVFPKKIYSHWADGIGMFKLIGKRGDGISGCLTMIRLDPSEWKAKINGEIDENLTKEIAEDKRLPANVDSIEPKHFPVFIEWQERIDKLQNVEV